MVGVGGIRRHRLLRNSSRRRHRATSRSQEKRGEVPTESVRCPARRNRRAGYTVPSAGSILGGVVGEDQVEEEEHRTAAEEAADRIAAEVVVGRMAVEAVVDRMAVGEEAGRRAAAGGILAGGTGDLRKGWPCHGLEGRVLEEDGMDGLWGGGGGGI